MGSVMQQQAQAQLLVTEGFLQGEAAMFLWSNWKQAFLGEGVMGEIPCMPEAAARLRPTNPLAQG